MQHPPASGPRDPETRFGQWGVSKHDVRRDWCGWAVPLSFYGHHEMNKLWAAHWPQEIESHLVRGEWSLQPGAKATPANRSSAGLPRPESH
ncbi:unnamed protein product [Rangifer tarandus platyrhynchus]|uniref:Uncharacterized protein n=1 Tax=Rangifer tarandus platyrhynchus TaxID=3082113 RepID=A0ABN8ZDD3_RANTA|nr:unnamed protein product [Rangifer tarandus platyrhynchus]